MSSSCYFEAPVLKECQMLYARCANIPDLPLGLNTLPHGENLADSSMDARRVNREGVLGTHREHG